MRLSKERRELIGSYGQELSIKNNILAIEELVEIFNQREENQTTLEETLHGLRRFIATTPKSDIKYAIYNDTHIFAITLDKKKIEDMISNTSAALQCDPGCECHNEEGGGSDAKVDEQDPMLRSNVMVGVYAEVAVCLYGLITVNELADVINNYELDSSLDGIAVSSALQIHTELLEGEVDYIQHEDYIVSPFLISNEGKMDSIDIELVDHISSQQESKERYLPSQEEFLKYLDPGYQLTNDAYENLRNFIIKNKNKLRYHAANLDSILFSFANYVKAGMTSEMYIRFFEEQGFTFSTLKLANEFLALTVDAHNHTRLYELKGRTPLEAGKPASSSDLRVVKSEKVKPNPTEQRKVEKVGRNEPCPCGSKKKYKKCCL